MNFRTRFAAVCCVGALVASDAAVGQPVRTVRQAELARSELVERATDVLHEAVQHADPRVRANAIEALSLSPGRLRPVAMDVLQDGSDAVRAVAAMAVARSGLAETGPRVAAMTRDPNSYVRASAIGGATMLGIDVDQTPLADLLLTARSVSLRSHAAFVLGEIGNPNAVPLLREAASRRVGRTAASGVRLYRLQVAEALAKLGEDAPLDAVRAALYPSRPDELEATALATQILGEVDDRSAIDELILLSERVDERGNRMPPEILLATAAALAKLGQTEGSFEADAFWEHPDAAVRAQAATVYGLTRGEHNEDRLSAMLEDPSAIVRVAAAGGILRQLGGAR